MKILKLLFLLLFLLAIPNSLNASERVSLLYGQYPKRDSHLLKMAALNVQFKHSSTLPWLYWKAELGTIEDLRIGAKHQDYLAMGIGVDYTHKFLYASGFLSTSILYPKDAFLGGPIQFHEDIYVGFRESDNDIRIGAFFKHISSASIYKPNRGKNLLGLSISIPF